MGTDRGSESSTSFLPPGGHHRDPSRERVLWLAAYVVAALAPLALVFAADDAFQHPPIIEFSVAIGFVGLMLLALQVVIPSRAGAFTTPFGIDVLLRFHRQMGLVALGLVVAHVVILIADNTDLISLLNPLEAPNRARAGLGAVVALALLTFTSLWRARARLSYERWRGLHVALGIAILVLSLAHIIWVGHYVAFRSLRWVSLLVVVLALLSIAYLRFARPFAAAGRPYRVSAVRPERGGATTIELEADGHRGDAFRPGQFAWLKFHGAPYALVEHPFSYSSSSHRPARPAFTIKARGDFTEAVAELDAGTAIIIDGPHGSFRPAVPDGPFLLVAAGVGITPVRSILQTLADEGDRRELILVYGSRSWEEVTFREELADVEKELDLRVIHVLSRPDADWSGETGRISAELLERVLPMRALRWNVFVCGPPQMTEGLVRELVDLGFPRQAVHAERFVSA